MSRKTRKRGRRRLLVIVVLLALIVFGVFARGLFTSGKTTAERAQRELDSYAEKNDASLDDYPDALVQLYARNPDARDFVRDYPKKKDLTPTIDLSGLAGSETVPLLLQWDERWGYREYNESIIGLAGCGPTCLSMVTIYLTGDTTKDPLWMCQFAEAHQFNVPGSGSKWALISEGGRMLGLDVTQIPLDKDRIYRNLDVGNPIIVVVGPGETATRSRSTIRTAPRTPKRAGTMTPSPGRSRASGCCAARAKRRIRRSLAEFRRRSGERKSCHLFRRYVRRKKYFSGCKCEICAPAAHKFCAQQTASPLSENRLGFRQFSAAPSSDGAAFCVFPGLRCAGRWAYNSGI